MSEWVNNFVHKCVRACVPACVRAFVRACILVGVFTVLGYVVRSLSCVFAIVVPPPCCSCEWIH